MINYIKGIMVKEQPTLFYVFSTYKILIMIYMHFLCLCLFEFVQLFLNKSLLV